MSPSGRRNGEQNTVDRLLPSIIVGLVIGAALLGMLLGWRARQRRQADIQEPHGVPADPGDVVAGASGLYVATTRSGEPLERITVRRLGYPSRTVATVHDRGIVLELTGVDSVFIPAADLRVATRATWAIDKAVEPGGLVLLGWRLGDLEVDSYLRIDGDAQAFLDAAAGIATPSREADA